MTVTSGGRAWIGRAASCALGVILLLATLAKAVDPQAFAEVLRGDGLVVAGSPSATALLALALEGGIGLALLFWVRRPWVLAATAALVALFLGLEGREWWLAAHGALAKEGCGCFGNLVQRTPRAAFLEDLALLVPLLLLAGLGVRRESPRPTRRLAAVAVGVGAVVLLAWRAPGLPLDEVATRLRPGIEPAQLCVGDEGRICLSDVAPELATGRWWVVLADLHDAPRWADALNRASAAPGAASLLVLTAATPDEVSAFTWKFGPSYPVRVAPPALLRSLYRRLPRSFLVVDGRVTRTLSGLPPLAVAAQGEPSR